MPDERRRGTAAFTRICQSSRVDRHASCCPNVKPCRNTRAESPGKFRDFFARPLKSPGISLVFARNTRRVIRVRPRKHVVQKREGPLLGKCGRARAARGRIPTPRTIRARRIRRWTGGRGSTHRGARSSPRRSGGERESSGNLFRKEKDSHGQGCNRWQVDDEERNRHHARRDRGAQQEAGRSTAPDRKSVV